ncbi:MAG: hypothetical protein ACYDBP_07260 [Leptospirales bacterium]
MNVFGIRVSRDFVIAVASLLFGVGAGFGLGFEAGMNHIFFVTEISIPHN